MSDKTNSLIIAIVLTLILRFALYAEDCNLLVLSVTFLALYFFVRTLIFISRKIISRRKA